MAISDRTILEEIAYDMVAGSCDPVDREKIRERIAKLTDTQLVSLITR